MMPNIIFLFETEKKQVFFCKKLYLGRLVFWMSRTRLFKYNFYVQHFYTFLLKFIPKLKKKKIVNAVKYIHHQLLIFIFEKTKLLENQPEINDE